MKIVIDDKPFSVKVEYADTLTEQLWQLLEQMYTKHLPDSVKVGLMAVTRAMLVKSELAVRLTQGKEAARAMRPPPGTDPNLWMFRQFLPQAKREIEGVTITAKTDGDTIGAFRLYSEGDTAGGQMDTARSVGMRKNNCIEIP